MLGKAHCAVCTQTYWGKSLHYVTKHVAFTFEITNHYNYKSFLHTTLAAQADLCKDKINVELKMSRL